MRLLTSATVLVFLTLVSGAYAADAPPDKTWIEHSNAYTNQLLAVQFEHNPERASRQGVAKFDERISVPTLADEKAERAELEKTLAQIDAARAHESDKQVLEDLDILHKAFDLQFRQQDYRLAHEVPFMNASEMVFEGLHGLLDDQVAPERRKAALLRLRRYAGLEAGFQPFTEILKQRELEQVAKPGVLYPFKGELETELGRNPNYLDGMAKLFSKYGIKDWEDPYGKIKVQLAAYDDWVRSKILPKARTDFRLPPQKYALAFEEYGIDLPPQKIAAMAHAAFSEYQAQMAPLAAQVAHERRFASSDYRAVIARAEERSDHR